MGWGHDSNRNLVQYQLGIPEFNLESPKNKTMKQISKQTTAQKSWAPRQKGVLIKSLPFLSSFLLPFPLNTHKKLSKVSEPISIPQNSPLKYTKKLKYKFL
jgi:hypothetical protein